MLSNLMLLQGTCVVCLWHTVHPPVIVFPGPKWHTVQWRFRQPAVCERGAVSLWQRMQ
jgi:hypothetical protein